MQVGQAGEVGGDGFLLGRRDGDRQPGKHHQPLCLRIARLPRRGGRDAVSARSCGVVDRDTVEQLFADLFAAVLDGQDRRATHQLREAADHAAAAAVEVFIKAHQAAGAVGVQAQQGFQSGDQRPPLLALGAGAVGEGRGRDDGEPAGDLAAADTGEQALRLHIDAGINEGGRQPFVIFS